MCYWAAAKHGAKRVDTFANILANTQQSRDEALEMLARVNAGTAEFGEGMSRERALDLLNGSIFDFNTIIKRLGRN